MPIPVVCPGCSAKLNAPDAAAGKTVKCPKCKEPLLVPAEAAASFEVVDEPAPPVKPKAAVKRDVVLDDDDEKPVTKKKKPVVEADDDEEDERPRKKGKKKPVKAGLSPVIIASIVGGVLLLGGAAFAIYYFASGDSEAKPTAGGNLPNYANAPGAKQGPGGFQPPGPPGGFTPPGPGPTPGDGIPATPPTPSKPSGPVKPLYDSNHAALLPYRSVSSNNMKQIGLAMHNFSSVYNGGFPAGITDSKGNIGLSWRVAILPFIEQEGLYQQFKLDEPWDSEHNKKLIPLMPKTYAAPGQDPKNGKTFYRSFTGTDTMFPPPQRGAAGKPVFGVKLSGVPDGTSNTGVVVEAGDSVEWTKPDELIYSASGAPPRVGGIFADHYFVLLADGSVRRLKISTPEATLRAIITARGGEIVDFQD